MNIAERWRHERVAAHLSEVAARAETDPRRSTLFRDLSRAALEQASILEAEATRRGVRLPAFRPDARARLVARLTRALGPRRAAPLLAAMKVRGLAVYGAQLHPTPTANAAGESHARGAGNVRAAVFGVNDGIVSNTSLILGVAGAAGADAGLVLTSGVAGLLAGGMSMAAGEWVSVRSQRELYEHQIAQERDELERYPEDEAEELALIDAARGIPLEEARRAARELVKDPERALALLAREELRLNPDDLGSPGGAAIASFLSFVVGAAVPLVPFALPLPHPVLIGAALSGVSLLLVGMALSLFSGRSAAWGGLRMLLIGAAAGAATYAIGRLLGVAA